MGDGPRLPILSRLLLFIPTVLCIIFTVYTLYQYERCLQPSAAECSGFVVKESEATAEPQEVQNEEIERGKEIREEYRESLEKQGE